MLREEVRDALKSPSSALAQLAKDWRDLLFPDADDERFADAYAQTVTFAQLLARSEGAQTLDEDLHQAVKKLALGDYVKGRPTRRRHPGLGSARRRFVLATLSAGSS
jgi:hypothetical protein